MQSNSISDHKIIFTYNRLILKCIITFYDTLKKVLKVESIKYLGACHKYSMLLN